MTEASYKWLVLFGCWLMYFVFGLGVSSLAPLVSIIKTDLQLTSSQMGTVLGAWQFIYIFVAIPIGLMLQRLGPGRMLIVAAGIIAVSGFMRASAQSHWGLLLAVAVFGIGGPIVSAGVPQTIGKWFAGKRRGLAMGIYITGPAIAGMVAYAATNSVLLPVLDDWRSVLRLWAWCAIFAGLVWSVIWLYGRRLPGAPPAAHGEGTGYRLADAWDILRDRNVRVLLLLAMGVLMIGHGLRNWMPEIIAGHGWSATTAGYLASIPVAFGIFGALVFPSQAVPKRRLAVLRLLFASSAAGCVLLQAVMPGLLVAGLILIGLGSGAMMTVTLLALLEQPAVKPERAGLAGGLFFAFAEVGGVTGPVLIGVLHDVTNDFDVALYTFSGAALLLIAVSMGLQRVSSR